MSGGQKTYIVCGLFIKIKHKVTSHRYEIDRFNAKRKITCMKIAINVQVRAKTIKL